MRSVLIWSLLLTLPACRSIGPGAMRSTCPKYNHAVRQVVSEELLLNVVRFRYLDPLQFMSIGTVSAQFSLGLAGGFEGGVNEDNPHALASGGIQYRDAPTLTFTPRHDTRFTKLLTQPIDMNTFSTMTLGKNGWSWALLLAGMSINGAQSDLFGGNQGRFDRRMQILADLQRHGHISMGRTVDTYAVSEPLPKTALDPLDLIAAAERSYRFESVSDGQVQLVARRNRPAMRVRSESLAEVATDLRALGLAENERVYVIKPPTEMGESVEDSKALYIGTRSFLGMLRIMSGGVAVPSEHRRRGLAPEEVLEGIPAQISEVFRVRSCCERPQARLAVWHRGYWWYIDDADSVSRTGFHILALLYDLELGVNGGEARGPVLTLPVGR